MPKNNVQAKHRQPPMPLAARHSFSNGSKSRSQETSQRVQVMFKAKYIYKNYAFSIFDHTTMRKKTHQNELGGWKQDGWALALAKISSFAISSMAPKTSTFFDLKTCLRSKAPHSKVLRQADEVWMWFKTTKTTTCLDRFLMISFCANLLVVSCTNLTQAPHAAAPIISRTSATT